jgi:hypothetical protein
MRRICSIWTLAAAIALKAIGPDGRYVFGYDAVTIAELEQIASECA